MKYDWNRYGHPRRAMATRMAGWALYVSAAVAVPRLLWLAAGDWTLALPALLITAGVAVQRLGLREVYGVREPSGPREADRLRERVYRRNRQAVKAIERAQRRPRRTVVVNGSEAKPVTRTPAASTTWEASALLGLQSRYEEIAVGLAPTGPLRADGSTPFICAEPAGWHMTAGWPGTCPELVARWRVTTEASTPVAATEQLREAEDLLGSRLAGSCGPGPRWFRLKDGELLDPCAHPGAVPVDAAWTGERVAWLCPECDAQLPADWR